MSYLPHSDGDIREMLAAVGARSLDDLFDGVPAGIRLRRALELPDARSEYEVASGAAALARRNPELLCFAGAGIYDHYAPAVVDHLLRRSEFYTAYTPYQPEVAQGTLQAIYEFQSLMCELSGLEVANASMYDGASACAEAVVLARSVKQGRPAVALAHTVHPHYRRVVETYLREGKMRSIVLARRSDGTVDLDSAAESLGGAACLLVQQPNFLGVIEDLQACAAAAHRAGALLVVIFDPVAMAVLKSPGSCGADVAVAEGQGLGIAMSFGGPALGIFTARAEYLRLMPGRIAGRTVDGQGRRGFVLTLQTREQHIRREKATSNICTNQALLALAATIHLGALGPQGLRRVAEASCVNAHAAFDAVTALPRFEPLCPGGAFFKEFAVTTPKPAAEIVRSAAQRGVLAGVALDRFATPMEGPNALLIAVTEKRSAEDVDRLVAALQAA